MTTNERRSSSAGLGGSASQVLALRCRIVLACADGDCTHTEIAAELGCNLVTVSK